MKRDEKMSIEGEKRVKAIEEIIRCHCEKEDTQLASLLPLVDLIPTLQSIADEKKLNMEVNKRVAAIAAKITRIIGFISLAIGTLFLIVQLIFKLKE